MEQRLIDANEIYDKVESNYRMSEGVQHKCEREFLNLLCDAPTVEAVPVVHAYWKTITRHEHFPSGKPYEADYCSNPKCGRRGSVEFDYCPWCGAKMDCADGERRGE